MSSDWVGLLGLLTGVGLALFGIYLSIRFYRDTVALERSVVQMLAKIEMLALSSQEIQNELIRSAWHRWVGGHGEAQLTRMESAQEGVVGTAVVGVTDSKAPGESQDSPLDSQSSKLVGLLLDDLLALRIVLDRAPVTSRIVKLPQQDPIVHPAEPMRPPGRLNHLPLARFRTALDRLVEAGLVAEVRVAQDGGSLYVELASEFDAFRREEREVFPAVLKHLIETADLKQQYTKARPVS